MNDSIYHRVRHCGQPMTRREFLGPRAAAADRSGLLVGPGAFARASSSARGVLSGGLHHPPKAKRVVQMFMGGAASHVDTFDYKPS